MKLQFGTGVTIYDRICSGNGMGRFVQGSYKTSDECILQQDKFFLILK
jgi:hypothetical protein